MIGNSQGKSPLTLDVTYHDVTDRLSDGFSTSRIESGRPGIAVATHGTRLGKIGGPHGVSPE